MTLGELAEMLETSATSARPRLEADLVKIGAVMEVAAKELIGHEVPGWPPLASSTIEEKERHGYVGRVSATDPLLRTGEMRESIGVEIDPANLALALGSKDKVALYQEMGTSRIPPRPFLRHAMVESFERAEVVLGETALELLTPGGLR